MILIFSFFVAKQAKSSKSPPNRSTSTPSSSKSCLESVKDLIRQLAVEEVKIWLQNTMFRYLAELCIKHRMDGKELLEISKTARLKNDTLMLSGYELVTLKDVVNCLGFELEFK